MQICPQIYLEYMMCRRCAYMSWVKHMRQECCWHAWFSSMGPSDSKIPFTHYLLYSSTVRITQQSLWIVSGYLTVCRRFYITHDGYQGSCLGVYQDSILGGYQGCCLCGIKAAACCVSRLLPWWYQGYSLDGYQGCCLVCIKAAELVDIKPTALVGIKASTLVGIKATALVGMDAPIAFT